MSISFTLALFYFQISAPSAKFFALLGLVTGLTIHTSCPAAQPELDSLDAVFRNSALPDTTRFAAAQRLTFSLIFSDGPRAKHTIDEALKDVEHSQGKTETYYSLYQNLGIYHDVNQETERAKEVFAEILEESKKQGWEKLEQRAYNNLGMNSLNSSNYGQAIEYFSGALELTRKNPLAKEADYVNYISNLGLANQELELYEQAIKYHLEALAIRERIGDANGTSISCANLGICYRLSGDTKQALTYFLKAIERASEAGNRTQFHRVHDNLGSLYIGMGDYAKGLEMLHIALDTTDGFFLDPKLKLSIASNAAAAHVDLEQWNEAERFAAQGLEILQAHPELVNYAPTITIAQAQIHFQKGEFDKGRIYLEKYQKITKEVFRSENAQLLTKLQVQYDLEKKENRIALQNAELLENKALIQRNYFAFAALGLSLILLVATFIYYQNRNQRKQQILVKDREIKVKETYIKASLESQERERRRMAQDLHDGFGQYISALRIYVEQFKNHEVDEALKQELIGRTGTVLDEMSREISNVVYDLMPATLIQMGLLSALEEFAQRINAGRQVAVTVRNTDVQIRSDETLEINLFRICQEWINNVLKYSGARQISIALSMKAGAVNLAISDDGRGFDPHMLSSSKGNGWKNINTRADLLDAKLELHTKTGAQGTTLQIRFYQQQQSLT